MTISSILANHIANTTFEDMPSQVVERTEKSILDAIGVSLAASGLCEGCKAFVDLAEEEGSRPSSTIFGFPVKASAAMAAFANGALAHALDFEDAHDTALVHANAAAIPAALALAEEMGGVSGKQVITALAVGCDLVCRLGLALKENNSDNGWYLPPILGALGAAAAAGNLMRLNPDQVLNALSLTLCQVTCSAEFRYSPQSDLRAVRDAFAAKAAVVGAQLARKGVKGFHQPFEGKAGFFKLYAGDNYEAEELTNELGRRFEGENTSFKPWPACRGTHAFIEAALKIMDKTPVDLDRISAIHMRISALNRMLCEPMENKKRPANAIEAKFSLPFAVGTALVHKAVTLDHFMSGALGDERVLAVAAKASYEVDPAISLRESTRGDLEITTRDGRRLNESVVHPLGNPQNPIPMEALIDKFQQCALHAANRIPANKLDQAVDQILHLEETVDIRELMSCLSA
jgi:2-methylcitrate dehydratase PrpD